MESSEESKDLSDMDLILGLNDEKEDSRNRFSKSKKKDFRKKCKTNKKMKKNLSLTKKISKKKRRK